MIQASRNERPYGFVRYYYCLCGARASIAFDTDGKEIDGPRVGHGWWMKPPPKIATEPRGRILHSARVRELLAETTTPALRARLQSSLAAYQPGHLGGAVQ
jgi:hypothetical protein